MTDEENELELELEMVKRVALDLWGLDGERLDLVDAYHAFRILKIREGSDMSPSFDDFAVRWKRFLNK